jgi:pilus assembly protein Flp/PilA
MALPRKLLVCVRRLLRQEDGPTATEYAILLCLIVVALIGSIMGLSQSIRQVFVAASQTLTLPA